MMSRWLANIWRLTQYSAKPIFTHIILGECFGPCVCVCVWGELKDLHTLSLWPILRSLCLCILPASFSAPDSCFTEKQTLTDTLFSITRWNTAHQHWETLHCVLIHVCLLPQALCLFMLNTNWSQVLQALTTAHLLTSNTHTQGLAMENVSIQLLYFCSEEYANWE